LIVGMVVCRGCRGRHDRLRDTNACGRQVSCWLRVATPAANYHSDDQPTFFVGRIGGPKGAPWFKRSELDSHKVRDHLVRPLAEMNAALACADPHDPGTLRSPGTHSHEGRSAVWLMLTEERASQCDLGPTAREANSRF
jgi:hypothetical protein